METIWEWLDFFFGNNNISFNLLGKLFLTVKFQIVVHLWYVANYIYSRWAPTTLKSWKALMV